MASSSFTYLLVLALCLVSCIHAASDLTSSTGASTSGTTSNSSSTTGTAVVGTTVTATINCVGDPSKVNTQTIQSDVATNLSISAANVNVTTKVTSKRAVNSTFAIIIVALFPGNTNNAALQSNVLAYANSTALKTVLASQNATVTGVSATSTVVSTTSSTTTTTTTGGTISTSATPSPTHSPSASPALFPSLVPALFVAAVGMYASLWL